MTLRPLYSLLALAVATSLLAACSHEDSGRTSAQAAAPAFAAVARGRIDVEGGMLKLSMPREGVVAEIRVHEGDHVHKGQVLAVLDTKPAQLAVNAAEAEQKQAEAQARLLEVRLKSANDRADRLAAAAAAGAGDGLSADEAREAAHQLQGELDSARAAGAIATQKLDAARYELSQRTLLAPIDAQVVERDIQPGAGVSPQGGPAFVLLPEGARIVRAELNESFVAAVHEGMHAQVVDDSGSGAPTLSAHVQRIGTVFGPSALEEDPLIRANTRTVECVLAFDEPPPPSLRIGQRVIVQFTANNSASAKPGH
ncbi:HlyD family efflux transporter periplasmic adaptor subunit [Dyella solisilvae]|uniref:HlyD family efflux transporter periplasmic adaptor subunit n=1 Tax=Dyella solisilvae TaxID=1920168 RepID=A0A370KBQ9_9GAMM|nr:HlyD family efflux transporter periplasmic adaptor subunit [Dyella solisilvae]RDJ00093.1 HlyD family efflux transporter periplasmic adaptor subunit [Dyella solisilvae]